MALGDVIFTAKLNSKPFDKAIKALQRKKLNWKFFTAGLNASTEKFKEAQREALKYREIYESLVEEAMALKEQMAKGLGGPSTSQQMAWEDLSKKIRQAKQDMEEAEGFMRLAEKGKKTKELFEGIGDGIENAFKSFLKIATAFAKGVLGTIFGVFKSLFSLMLKGVGVIFALAGATLALGSGFSNLIKVDNATASSLNRIKTAVSGLSNAMATAVAPLIQAVEPVLVKIIDWFTRAATAVAMFFSALTGKKVTVVATQVADGMSGIGNAANGANEQAKELKRTLLGFDKINKLDNNNGSGGGGSGGGGSGGGGGGFATVPVSEDALDWAERFKESWEKADFYWLGELLAEKINDALERIPWDKINDILQRIAKSIGTFLNGFIENLDWRLLGETISNGIKAALDFAITLLNTINWEAIGKAIVDFLTGIDWLGVFKRVFIDLPSAMASAIFNTLKGALQEVIDVLPDAFKNALNNLGANISFGINTDAIDKIKEKLANLKSIISGIKGTTAKITLSLVDSFSAKWNKVKKAWNGIKSKTAEVKLKFTEAIKSKWNAIAKKVNSARAKGGLAKTLLPQMPYLAQGGYVKRNAPQLAMIGDNRHEGEIVAPESKLQEMANKASSNPQVVLLLTQILGAIQSLDTDVYLDGESIKNNTVRRINNHTRATGQLELII